MCATTSNLQVIIFQLHYWKAKKSVQLGIRWKSEKVIFPILEIITVLSAQHQSQCCHGDFHIPLHSLSLDNNQNTPCSWRLSISWVWQSSHLQAVQSPLHKSGNVWTSSSLPTLVRVHPGWLCQAILPLARTQILYCIPLGTHVYAHTQVGLPSPLKRRW